MDRNLYKSDLAAKLSANYADIWQTVDSIHPSLFSTVTVGLNMSCSRWGVLLFFVLLVVHLLSLSADFSVAVVSVLDGDTIEVLPNRHPKRIRLSGIDCQRKAKLTARRRGKPPPPSLSGKKSPSGPRCDMYKRILGDVLLPDGTNVNHTLVKDGWCWWYRKYAPDDTVLEGLEQDARERKKGLWIDSKPVPPWIYRKGNR